MVVFLSCVLATGLSARNYLVGRSAAEERMLAFIGGMQVINPKAQVIWTQAEVSLLAEANNVCRDIGKRESCVDLLFMSAGYAPSGSLKAITDVRSHADLTS